MVEVASESRCESTGPQPKPKNDSKKVVKEKSSAAAEEQVSEAAGDAAGEIDDM